MAIRSCLVAATAALALAGIHAPAWAAGNAGGIVIRAQPGGKNPAFCMPQWSIANETGQDIGALLIQAGADPEHIVVSCSGQPA